jgi:hypothetical protein
VNEPELVIKKSHFPPGFREAGAQYDDDDCIWRSALWEWLQAWREYVKCNPEAAPTEPIEYSGDDDGGSIEEFKNMILEAVFYGDKDILQAVCDIVTLTKPPEPHMHGIRAARAAFRKLFKGDGSEADRPEKKEVRELATDILRKAGKDVPVDRHWPRIFDKAGLKSLRSRKPKSKRA